MLAVYTYSYSASQQIKLEVNFGSLYTFSYVLLPCTVVCLCSANGVGSSKITKLRIICFRSIFLEFDWASSACRAIQLDTERARHRGSERKESTNVAFFQLSCNYLFGMASYCWWLPSNSFVDYRTFRLFLIFLLRIYTYIFVFKLI